MKPSRWAAVGAVAWLLLAGAGAYLTTEVWHPDLAESRKDTIHGSFGQAGGMGFIALLFVVGALYAKER